jgi:hypothetical protein
MRMATSASEKGEESMLLHHPKWLVVERTWKCGTFGQA